MDRKEIIEELKNYFDIKELVCKDVYEKFGETSWQFFMTEALHTLFIIRRDILQVPLICNNWFKKNGTFSQRGLRCNLCELVSSKTKKMKLSMSAHSNGAAFDLTSPQMDASKMRSLVIAKQELLPYNIRLENDVDWLHFDLYSGEKKITYFDA